MNRRQVLKGLVSAVAWLPLLATKRPAVSNVKIHNPIKAEDLPRKIMNFPSLVRNGGKVGHESFITEWHVRGPYSHISNVSFINTEIHIHGTNSAVINCDFKNVQSTNFAIRV